MNSNEIDTWLRECGLDDLEGAWRAYQMLVYARAAEPFMCFIDEAGTSRLITSPGGLPLYLRTQSEIDACVAHIAGKYVTVVVVTPRLKPIIEAFNEELEVFASAYGEPRWSGDGSCMAKAA